MPYFLDYARRKRRERQYILFNGERRGVAELNRAVVENALYERSFRNAFATDDGTGRNDMFGFFRENVRRIGGLRPSSAHVDRRALRSVNARIAPAETVRSGRKRIDAAFAGLVGVEVEMERHASGIDPNAIVKARQISAENRLLQVRNIVRGVNRGIQLHSRKRIVVPAHRDGMVAYEDGPVRARQGQCFVFTAQLVKRKFTVELDVSNSGRAREIGYRLGTLADNATFPVGGIEIRGGIGDAFTRSGKIPHISLYRRRTRQPAKAQSRKQQNNRHVLFFHDHITFLLKMA